MRSATDIYAVTDERAAEYVGHVRAIEREVSFMLRAYHVRFQLARRAANARKLGEPRLADALAEVLRK